ncbi:MAG: type II CRISPR-associated endonuclease Cas1 [Bacteroidetes bacterium]|nr:type II CRISPR-associated endonuclease Cas1 [Bacteroidota bacterium]
MIKRTIFITNPAKLSVKNLQLIVKTGSETEGNEVVREIPIEDIGILLLEHPQINLTHVLISTLMENNTIVITCNNKFMPSGITIPFEGNSLLTKRYKTQINASEQLKKNLWQQVIKAKILNQAGLLERYNINIQPMKIFAAEVLSGDTKNCEGAAARYYWDNIFTTMLVQFRRDRYGEDPNNALNFVYAILRSIMARAIVGSGLLPALGIHHRNKYNAYCLADDLMEPFRPFADSIVLEMIKSKTDLSELNKQLKAKLLGIATMDVNIGNERSPLIIASQKVTSSLVACFEGSSRKLELPVLK